jgi:hypothetical protein
MRNGCLYAIPMVWESNNKLVFSIVNLCFTHTLMIWYEYRHCQLIIFNSLMYRFTANVSLLDIFIKADRNSSLMKSLLYQGN